MSVNISIAYNQPRASTNLLTTLQGGLKIEVSEKEITRFEKQKDLNANARKENPNRTWWYDYQGNSLDAGRYDYKGSYIDLNVNELLNKICDVRGQDTGRFEEVTVDLEDTNKVIVMSCLDESREFIRLAFQNKFERTGKKYDATIESSVGLPVELEDLCHEIVQCSRNHLEYLRKSGFCINDSETITDFKSGIDELDSYLK